MHLHLEFNLAMLLHVTAKDSIIGVTNKAACGRVSSGYVDCWQRFPAKVAEEASQPSIQRLVATVSVPSSSLHPTLWKRICVAYISLYPMPDIVIAIFV